MQRTQQANQQNIDRQAERWWRQFIEV